MIYNIIYDICYKELYNIAQEMRTTLLEKKIIINPSLNDCINTYFVRKGITSWLSEYITGPFQILIFSHDNTYGVQDVPSIINEKPWWKSTHSGYSGEYLNGVLPIVFRFEDEDDAMLFKMTYIKEKS